MIAKHLAAIFLSVTLLSASPAAAEKTSKNKLLSSSQIMRISGEAGLQDGSTYGGNFYNGNSDIFITEIAVYVKTTRGGEVFPRLYYCRVQIPPLSTTPFGFDIIVGDEGSDYTWGIFEAKGYEVTR
jgi:hypothetical protein